MGKNTELKRKVAHLRNELELVNQSRSVSLDRVQKKSRNSRRLSDPDEIRFYAYERDFDGVFYRQLKNNQEIADDHSKLGEQNKAKENVFANIENLKSELRDLNKKLKASDMKSRTSTEPSHG